jgi:hypothetical protein
MFVVLSGQPVKGESLLNVLFDRRAVQLTEVEAAFRALKSELAIRPIWHRIQRRVEAHILVAFLGYCL